jgi:hypothetical protein
MNILIFAYHYTYYFIFETIYWFQYDILRPRSYDYVKRAATALVNQLNQNKKTTLQVGFKRYMFLSLHCKCTDSSLDLQKIFIPRNVFLLNVLCFVL